MSDAQSTNGPWTVARLLAWTREYFERSSVESPRLCAEILLSHALNCERIELYTRHEAVPDSGALDRFRGLVKQAADGKPIAYLTGSKEFFSLAFEVSPDVLIPRPETELLVERIVHMVRRGGMKLESILDLGTGSGCIAIALARNLPDVKIFASDVSEAALALAQKNAERLGVAQRIEFRAGDLLEPWTDAGPFDAIASNPPYIAEHEAESLPRNVRDFEPRSALFAGADGLDVIRRLVDDSHTQIADGGHLLFEVAYNQAPSVRNLLDETRWRDIVTYRDGAQHERVVHARKHVGVQTQAS